MERAAQIVGLSSFETPTLEAVERRRLQLWMLSSVILIATTVGFVLFAFRVELAPPPWLTGRVSQFGLLGLSVLFCAYGIEKELHLRRLTELLVREQVLTAALTNRLREVSTLLEAGKAINLGLDLDDVLSTIVGCAQELLDGRDASIMLTAGNRELLTMYSRASQDLGLGPVTAVDPLDAGAADVSFTAAYVDMAIDGLGMSGTGGHTVEETGVLSSLPSQAKRAALLMYRLYQSR